ncbi:MAG: LysM peptidoglycan-binding domain-containing protein [Clostridia bacterium]|jgi:GH25 family lysozyme M1 (1,4-beta-N-acetylmuramidase)|nr:LysM peptidoglycan-binding domain-containing protein [Clostridia bacterium]MBP3680261.1 LysM peptidoglycan-binding domain-containing protein [Clostridia bacterium]
MRGIDVSAHQGNINWDAVKTSGIEFAIIRISYGQSAVDSKAIRNIEECIRVGIPFGVYTYSYALNIDNAINEANLVIKTLAPYKNKIKFPVIIDMEDADGYKAKYGMPSNDTLVSICEKECLMFEEAGYYAAIYASKSWFDSKLNSSKLNRFDKWMAWWSTSASSKFDHNTYGLWQYTSSGKVNGISGNVDMNESFKDYPSMINTESSNTTSQTPTKSIDDLAQEVINQQWGNGDDRKQRLTSAGYDYNAVQNRVNEILGASSKKSNEEIANEVIAGKWDVGQTRKEKLTAAGYDYNTIQAIVNSKCGSSSSSKSYTVKSGDTLSGIGAKLGINWKTIADKNGIKSPYTIYPGQVLKY